MENEGSVLLWVCMKLQSERVSTSVYEARDLSWALVGRDFALLCGWVLFFFVFLCVFFFGLGVGSWGRD